MGDFSDLKKVIVAFVIIAAVATLLGVVGEAAVHYWPIVLLFVAAIVGLVIYRKRRKRLRDMV